jgi:hypothetical protein
MRDVHHAADLGCGLFAFEIPAYRLPVYFFSVASSHSSVLSLGTSVVHFILLNTRMRVCQYVEEIGIMLAIRFCGQSV